MVQYLYDNNIILYTYSALCGLGLLVRMIVNMVYKHLVKESDNLGETKNKMLTYIKKRFETCYKLKIGVNNVDTFVDKNVLKYRFCGILLSTWDNFSGQVLFLTLMIVPICAVFGVAYDCGQDQVLLMGAVGISASAILILVDKSMNLAGKKRMLRLNLLDYLENFCKVRLEQETSQPELVEQYRREYLQALEAGKQISAAAAPGASKNAPKDELNRRREERRKKEEERKIRAAKREEEQRRLEEARREEERRKQEERREAAARRREEERLRLEEERLALEARREELRRRAEEKQQANLRKHNKSPVYSEASVHSKEKQGPPEEEIMEAQSMIAATKESVEEDYEIEKNIKEKEKEVIDKDKSISEVKHQEAAEPNEKVRDINQKAYKSQPKASKAQAMSPQDEKIIEDVLKEFFA